MKPPPKKKGKKKPAHKDVSSRARDQALAALQQGLARRFTPGSPSAKRGT